MKLDKRKIFFFSFSYSYVPITIDESIYISHNFLFFWIFHIPSWFGYIIDPPTLCCKYNTLLILENNLFVDYTPSSKKRHLRQSIISRCVTCAGGTLLLF